MKWKELKPDASGAVTLFVAGMAILLLTCLLPSRQIRLGRGGPDVSRDAHPALYWACETVVVLAGVLCLVSGVRLFRSLMRRQRDEERNFEQQALDSFIREHKGDANDKDPSD